MNDLQKYVSGGLVAALLTIGAFLGFGSGGGDTKYIPAIPAVQAPMSLSADAKCPKPPRTGGAIFVDQQKGTVSPDGANKSQEYLNCDYAGAWSFTVRADGTEQLALYKGDGSPQVWNTESEINRVLADLR